MLLVHGNIDTMEDAQYEDGFIQIENGKIAAVGPMSEAPQDTEILDLQGGLVLPGFVDPHSHMGMWEDGLGFEGDDGNESTDPITPHLRAIDAINPFDRTFEEAWRAGITTVLTGPGSANPIAGQWAALKTKGRRIDDMVISPSIGMKFALGENPKTEYNDKDTSPVTRMATAALIREQLRKAQRYLEDIQRAEEEGTDEPEFDAKCDALMPVLKREQRAFCHAHRADDIFTAIRIAKEFHLNLVLVHCTEGYLIRDILANEDVHVIAGPILCDRSKPELRNQNIQNPTLLHEAGIRAALCTDHPVIPIQYLPLCAGLTIGAGMDRREALKSITIYAAEAAGIEDRVGSIRPGKDADLVLYEKGADPCGPYAHPAGVWIDGIRVVG